MRVTTLTGSVLTLSAVLAALAPLRAQAPKGDDEPAARAVARLVDQIRRAPVPRAKAEDRLRLYLIDTTNGEVTLVSDEPDPEHGLTHCGSPAWSKDGRRIVFDATPGNKFNLTPLESLEAGETRPRLTDLGPGNCPTVAPDADRVAFLLNNGAVEGAGPGIWMMQADGSLRRHLTDTYGRVKWSPDGRFLMIVSFANPCNVSLIDTETGNETPLRLAGQRIYSIPSWVDDKTSAAVVGAEQNTVALLDVSNPERVTVKETLWKQGAGLDVKPYCPVYSAATRRCVFVGQGPEGMALYTVGPGEPAPAKRLETEDSDKTLTDLALSPDGRYVLFSSDRPERKAP